MKQSVTRREFLKVAAFGSLALPLLSCATRAGKSTTVNDLIDTVGVQLYTVREALQKDPDATLNGIADIGYKQVETADINTITDDASYMQAIGLKVSSAHVPPPYVTGDWGDTTPPAESDFNNVVALANSQGLSSLVFPYVPPADRGGLDAYRKLGEQFNKAGEEARKMNITFCYHNHAFEFQPIQDSSPFQTLMESTDPDLVKLEVDVFWISVAGLDPARFIRQHAGRVHLLHLKDKKAGTPQMYDQQVAPDAFQPVGSGVLDFQTILQAASESGVRECYVEQDQTPGDPLVSLRQSYNYLQSLRT